MAIDFLSALARYQPYLSPADFKRLLNESAESAATAVRVNHLKVADAKGALNQWQARYGWETQPVPFAPDALQIRAAQTSPSQTHEHRFGYYYLQDAASLLPVSLFSPERQGHLMLDMAASPGGKTTQMVDSMRDRGFVMANDSSASRLAALRTVLQLWGATNTVVTNYAGEKLGDWFPGVFDQVLLDAPCSMESLRQSASHPHRPITSDERARLASRQLALLLSAVRAAKIGGEVVYSTCTLAPEEDEQVLDGLLKACPDAVAIAPPPAELVQAQGLISFEGQNFDPQVANSIRVWPFTFGTNGFFAAKIIKLKDLPSSESQPPHRDFSATGFVKMSPSRLADVYQLAAETYGFDFARTCADLGLDVFQRDTTLFLLPSMYLAHFSSLPYHALGMPLGKLIKNTVEFSVDFVSRFHGAFTRNTWTLPESLTGQWLSGADILSLEIPGARPGTVIAINDSNGVNLGAGKLNPGRLRNLLPNRNVRAW